MLREANTQRLWFTSHSCRSSVYVGLVHEAQSWVCSAPAVLRLYMISAIEVEVLPDDEYALWEQAVIAAEQQHVDRTLSRALQPEALQQQYPAGPDQSLSQQLTSTAEENLPDLEDFGLKVNSRAKHRPKGLRVTDITSAEWCQQQVAFTLSARLPKVRYFSRNVS